MQKSSRPVNPALEAYRQPLLQYARRKLNGNLDDAEDVVQEALVREFGAAKDIQHPAQQLNRLKRIVTNLIIDQSRERQRRPCESLDLILHTGAHQFADLSPGPGEIVEVEMLRARLFARLTPQEKRICELKLQGDNLLEIARELKITHDNCRKISQRAAQRLSPLCPR
jgi:RNA polymerase sigma factor (sigma-70 family)